jgi:protein gp37
MSDLFHERVPVDFVHRVFEVMTQTERHTFQILTKRPEHLLELAPSLVWPRNVWIGVSIENRRWIARADALREIPAAVRFISAEPLLGPLDGLDLAGIDWLIAGGESGARHRGVDERWIRQLRDMCREQHVPFFLKQIGGRTPRTGGRSLDGREWSEMPRPKTRAQTVVLA